MQIVIFIYYCFVYVHAADKIAASALMLQTLRSARRSEALNPLRGDGYSFRRATGTTGCRHGNEIKPPIS